MADHSELVGEMSSVERLSTAERLKHARKRRLQQLKKFSQYEKQLEKESSKKKKKQDNAVHKVRKKKEERVQFEPSVTLLEATARNDIDEVRRLLQSGVSPDETNEDGLTALHQCCIDGNEELLKLLLEYNANVNAKDSELWTPLHAAATCGHIHLCKYLISREAELLAVNADGNMPYDICEDEETLDYIETEMSKRGITQEEIDETRLQIEKLMLNDLKKVAKDRKALEKKDENGVTPLHIAAANGYLEVGHFLLSNRCSVSPRDDDSWQPIHAAAFWGQPEMLQMLVEHGANLDAKTRNGETAFDLCEDPELKQKILDMKDEIETNKSHQPHNMTKPHRISTRSASLRRSSLRGEKSSLFKKEAKEEALHFGLRTMEDDDDLNDDTEGKENLPATNIDDVALIVLSEESNIGDSEKDRPAKKTKSPERDLPLGKQNENVLAVLAAANSSTQEQSLKRKISASVEEMSSNSLKKTTTTAAASRTNASTTDTTTSTAKTQSKHVPSSATTTLAESSSSSSTTTTTTTTTTSQSKPTDTDASQMPPGNFAGSGSVPRYPSGVSSVSLSDLKKQRTDQRQVEVVDPYTQRRDNLEAQVQSMFLQSLQSDMRPTANANANANTSILPSNGKKDKTNGHNNNNSLSSSPPNRAYMNDGQLRRFTAPNHAAIVGGDEDKTSCCVIM
ncbi:protein phosphatase 1 regulatory subunit 16A-like isoform X2 [Gigantopelta aegis]|uniref:protein phosphatase 1 regulatory subunit 16A-like isoform X2 n=1 Tax=Gigantopelta aegis TaxID=1735272 RepID=UPI001B88B8E4|nr:protein phosphatase 1 regulatory subunit 16A-like isoform X2 [Gigantopelta aegis]